MTKPKRRPKVRFVARAVNGFLFICPADDVDPGAAICEVFESIRAGRRIAAALNVYEARRRGEL